MKTCRLMAIRAHKYGTRALTAGDEYDAPAREAVAHVAARKARFIKAPRKAEAKPEAIEEPAAAEAVVEMQPEPANGGKTIDDLRETAARLGLVVDGRWGVARLQHEIARHRR